MIYVFNLARPMDDTKHTLFVFVSLKTILAMILNHNSVSLYMERLFESNWHESKYVFVNYNTNTFRNSSVVKTMERDRDGNCAEQSSTNWFALAWRTIIIVRQLSATPREGSNHGCRVPHMRGYSYPNAALICVCVCVNWEYDWGENCFLSMEFQMDGWRVWA